MKMKLIRQYFYPTRTMGELWIDDKFVGHTMEDVVREPFTKVYGKTAIRKGSYRVIVNQSTRFKRELPLLLKVQNFEGIRIHGGNTEENSLGCILVGAKTNTVDRIWDCALTVKRVTNLIKSAGGADLEIVDEIKIDRRKPVA